MFLASISLLCTPFRLDGTNRTRTGFAEIDVSPERAFQRNGLKNIGFNNFSDISDTNSTYSCGERSSGSKKRKKNKHTKKTKVRKVPGSSGNMTTGSLSYNKYETSSKEAIIGMTHRHEFKYSDISDTESVTEDKSWKEWLNTPLDDEENNRHASGNGSGSSIYTKQGKFKLFLARHV